MVLHTDNDKGSTLVQKNLKRFFVAPMLLSIFLLCSFLFQIRSLFLTNQWNLAAGVFYLFGLGFLIFSFFRQVARQVAQAHETLINRLSISLDVGKMGFFEWNMSLNKMYWSDTLKVLWGYGYGEKIDSVEGFWERLHREDRPAVEDFVRESTLSRTRGEIDYRICLPNQGTRWISSRFRTDVDPVRKGIILTGTATDITERKHAENALRNSEARFRAIFDSNMIGVAFGDTLGVIHESNDYLLNLLGYERNELNSKKMSWSQITPTDYQECDQRALEEIQKTGTCTPYEKPYVRKDGSWVWVLIGITTIDSERKTLLGYVLDITQRKQAQEELRISQERIALAIEASNLGIWDCDLRTGAMIWSESLQKIFGFGKDGFLGTYKDVLKRIHPKDRLSFHRVIKEASQSKSEFNHEFRKMWHDGSIHWLQAKGRVYSDHDGKPARMAGVSIDITEHKRIEKDLKEALRARDEFVSIASHELKTPLTSIYLQLQFLNRSVQRNLELGQLIPVEPVQTQPGELTVKRIVELTRICEKQIKRLGELLDTLLDFTRIRLEGLSLNLKKTNLSAAIKEVVEGLRIDARAKGVDVSVKIDFQIEGIWDRLRIEQVISNLVTNALKYGEGKPVLICATCDSTRRTASISVQDQGIGITPEMQTRVFDRFERALHRHQISGFGLGLFITRQILEAHGGKIWVKSQVGKGSTFFVELPLDSRAQASGLSRARQERAPAHFDVPPAR